MKKVFALVLVSMFALVIGCGGSAPAADTAMDEAPAAEAPAADAGMDEAAPADDAGMDEGGMDDAGMDEGDAEADPAAE
ncbi:MAG: hypothetical protein JXX29_12950 [Deltaproteobacteria bacterium]|nr:hypothetical protein [Deltaproteobacteria bacterium]MBN2672585.1 hypothetical protein [Deltaproteobacteria bacterium]